MHVERILFAPGFSRVQANALTENTAVKPTAFRSPRSKTLVSVLSKDFPGTFADF
jgi:hypothetical protein